jgi:hypothetical protein
MLTKAWYIGNTTLRNPRRFRQGLEVYSNSNLHGNLIGKPNEQRFAILLHESGIVYSNRLANSYEQDTSDLGRKWRAALMQLGFITHSESRHPFVLTESGKRLINTTTLPQENECFLRALLVYQIPSPIEPFPIEYSFSPLRVVLEVLEKLDERGLESYITINEMACIVQRTGTDNINDAIELIKQYRIDYELSENKSRFKRDYRIATADLCQHQSEGTLKDYADTNFRYLRLTGLFNENARKLSIAPYKRDLVEHILGSEYIPIDNTQYLNMLWHGASLPSDNAVQAIQEINSLIRILNENGVNREFSNLVEMTPEDLSQLRLGLEDELFKAYERQYAAKQREQWQEISNYLKELANPRARTLIPSNEAPAYFEWAVWRAFLAINSLRNEPWEARRFRVDEDFYPINTAPGGGPDIIFEFDDFVLIVEVTLTTSSRQEAVEGEPVRRHVAQYVDLYESQGKRVYGLFLANNIDTNTAETFRIGCWFRQDDTKMAVQIVPLTITQFISAFEKIVCSGTDMSPRQILDLIRNCLAESNNEAPMWKSRIIQEVERFCRQ